MSHIYTNEKYLAEVKKANAEYDSFSVILNWLSKENKDIQLLLKDRICFEKKELSNWQIYLK